MICKCPLIGTVSKIRNCFVSGYFSNVTQIAVRIIRDNAVRNNSYYLELFKSTNMNPLNCTRHCIFIHHPYCLKYEQYDCKFITINRNIISSSCQMYRQNLIVIVHSSKPQPVTIFLLINLVSWHVYGLTHLRADLHALLST